MGLNLKLCYIGIGMNNMCEQEVTFNTLNSMSNNGGLNKGARMVFEAQIKDYKKMEQRMENVEGKVDTLIVDVADVKNDVSKILILLENKKPPLFDRLIDNKYFWIILIIIASSITGFTAVDSLKGL